MCGNDKLTIETQNRIKFVNRFKKMREFDLNNDSLFRPEFQEMFRVSEKVGFLRRYVHGVINGTTKNYISVLTDVGLLLLEEDKVSRIFIFQLEFKHFLPLLGTKLRNSKLDVKNKSSFFAIDIKLVSGNINNIETLIFESDIDKQEWVTKIRKVQEKAINR